jgi:hypothetical protein
VAQANDNPVSLVDSTGLDPLGVFNHQIIENAFHQVYPNFEPEVLHRDPNAPWWNPLLGSFRIDLEEKATRTFYEIKPWNEVSAGVGQVADRVNRGFVEGGKVPDLWINGWFPGQIVHAWWDSPGLLLYESTFEPPPAIPFPFPFPGRAPSRLPRNFPNPRPVPAYGETLVSPAKASVLQ